MKKEALPRCLSFERSGIQCHRSLAFLLPAISNHSLATLLAKMSAFKSHMRQNA